MVKKPKIAISYLFLTLFSFACDEKQVFSPNVAHENDEDNKKENDAIEKSLSLPEGTVYSPIGNLSSINALFFGDIVYNINDSSGKSKFDIFIPNIASDIHTVPLVIYIHGGGFNNRTKEDAYDVERHPYAGDIKKYIKKGFAFASIDFRNKSDFTIFGNINQIESCMGDIKKCIQFIRYNSNGLRINKMKMGAYGGSSGGCATLWLGLKDDMASTDSAEILCDPILAESTRLQAIGHYNSQCSYEKQFLIDIFFNEENNCLFPGPVDPAPHLDFPKFMTADDPDLYLYNDNEIDCSNTDKIGHHPYHAMILKEKAEEVWPTGISSGKIAVTIPSYEIPAVGAIVRSRNKSLFNFMTSRLK